MTFPLVERIVQAKPQESAQRRKHSMREERTEVLVVGAGPVGLLTAILLAEAGVEVKIIDREERTTARSYACALHPRTLKLLAEMGLAAPLLERGRRIETVAFYDGAARQAEVNLSELGGEFPFMVILPQNVFEEALEQRLRKAIAEAYAKHYAGKGILWEIFNEPNIGFWKPTPNADDYSLLCLAVIDAEWE